MNKYKPEKGKIVVVSSIPQCNFCDKPGPYDFATQMGPWTNGCEQHWQQYRVGPLGTGSGQLWITEDQVLLTPPLNASDDDKEDYASLADEASAPDAHPWNDDDWDQRAVEGAKRYAEAKGLNWPPNEGDYDRFCEAEYNA